MVKMFSSRHFTLSLMYIGCVFSYVVTAQEKVGFESGEYLQPVNEDQLQDADATNVKDPRETGSYVFDANQYGDTRLTFDIAVKDFRSQNSRYFRTHPVFMECLQLIFSYMDDKDKKIKIKRGFQTKNDVGASQKVKDDYSRSGCAAELAYVTGSDDVIHIAEAAMSQCMPLFASIQRDIGLVIMADSLHVHMTGSRDVTPYYESSGYTANTTQQFKSWCMDQIDMNIDPATTPDCSDSSELAVGKTHPPGASSEGAVVGKLDQAVLRNSKDFLRLAQFPGRTVVFENAGLSATWCGVQGTPCQDCRQGVVGNAPKSRCANRLMTYRMYNSMRVLQKLVRANIPGTKLKVVDSFDEPRAGKPDGDYPADSLHKEGRMAKLQLSTSASSDVMSKFSKLAVCSRFDYVKRFGNYLIVAVKKQKIQFEESAEFPSNTLLSVAPPFGKSVIYENPEATDGLPLFDSAIMQPNKLSPYSDVTMFKDPNNRYFRLDPRIVKCHELMEYKQNKWNSQSDPWVKIKVSKGYLTTSSQSTSIKSSDPRFNKHPTGRALQITNHLLEAAKTAGNDNESSAHLHGLVRLVLETCNAIWQQDGVSIGVGVYQDGVYMDIREEFDVWIDSSVTVPSFIGQNREQYTRWIKTRNEESIDGRVIDPDNLEVACKFSNPPAKKSIKYKYEHPESVKRRRRDTTTSATQCQPRRDTKFCSATKTHRESEVEWVWRQVEYKYLSGKDEELRKALEKCLGNCGTCLTGDVFEEKVENCENFIHWVPFEVQNDSPNVTNFLARSNIRMRNFACGNGKECIFRAPLFSLLAPSMERLYRPDPDKSVQEELYPSTENPLPLYDLMLRLYAIHAKDTVTVSVKSTFELTSLKDAVKVLMVYNRDVTKVEFKVDDPHQIVPVNELIENWLVDWVTGGCPKHAREVIAPFDVTSVPSGITKRSADGFSLSDEFFEKRRLWEHNWLNTKIH